MTRWSPDAEWSAEQRVRIDTLRKGRRFRAVDGRQYTYDHVDGGVSHGAHWVTREDGVANCFAGCAEVLPC